MEELDESIELIRKDLSNYSRFPVAKYYKNRKAITVTNDFCLGSFTIKIIAPSKVWLEWSESPPSYKIISTYLPKNASQDMIAPHVLLLQH
jgi:hypothetical protein